MPVALGAAGLPGPAAGLGAGLAFADRQGGLLERRERGRRVALLWPGRVVRGAGLAQDALRLGEPLRVDARGALDLPDEAFGLRAQARGQHAAVDHRNP